MGVTEEIFRLRYDTVGQQQVVAAQANLKRLGTEAAFAEAMFKVGATSVKEYTAALARMEQQAKRSQAVINRWNTQSAGKAGAGRDSIMGGAGRGNALGRTGFALANIAQDIGQAGPSAALNNVLNPMMWDDLAKAIGGGRLALAGFGTAAIAAGAGYIAIDRGLKHASLGWGDFLDVVGNLAPIEGAGQAIEGLGLMLKESGIIDFVDTFVGDVADYTLGWRDATEAVRQHKQILGETANIQKGVAGAAEKFQSAQQKEDNERGTRFGQALADLGGTGGIQGIGVKLGKGSLGMMLDAIGGNQKNQRRITDMLGQMGMDTGGLEAAMKGPGVGIDDVVKQVKEENDLFAKGQADDEAKQKADLAHKVAVNKEVAAAMEAAKAGAIEDVPHAQDRVIAGLRDRLGGGMGADQAASEVAQGLVSAIGDAIPEADAKDAAKAFVDEQLKALKDEAAGEKLASPYAMTMRQLDLQQSAMGLDSAMRGDLFQGPKTMDAGSFATSVQDSQKPLVDTLREGLDLQKRQIEYLQKVADNTRMNTLVGP